MKKKNTTVNPPGDGYEDFVAALKRTFDELGYETEVVRGPESRLEELAPHAGGRARPHLRATLEDGTGPTVHRNGHYDVVPVSNDWTRDPFGGELAGGWIYCRGVFFFKQKTAYEMPK